MQKSFWTPFLVLPLIALTFASCSRSAYDGASSNVTGIAVSQGSYKMESPNFDVCFENHGTGDAKIKHYREEIKNYLVGQFSRTVVRLNGWGDCASFITAKQKIRISFTNNKDVKGSVAGLSNIGAWDSSSDYQEIISGFTYRPTLLINFQMFQFDQSNYGFGYSLNVKTKNTLLHEFGHAIGLWHEHSREASTCSVSDEREPWHNRFYKNQNFIKTRNFDPQSIMNYCFVDQMDANLMVASLSPGDVETINAIYTGTLTAGIVKANEDDPSKSPAYPTATSNPAYPSAPSIPAYPSAPSNPAYPSAPSNPAYPPAPSIPAYPPAPSIPAYPPAPTYTYCNESQLQICIEYEGGAACYPKWCY